MNNNLNESSSLSDVIDEKADIIEQKRTLNAELKVLSEYENEIDFMLIKKMDTAGVTLTRNDRARVSINESLKPKCDDWDVLQQYIIDTGSWELLNRALNAKSYKDTLELGVEVPGMSSYTKRTVSFGKNNK